MTFNRRQFSLSCLTAMSSQAQGSSKWWMKEPVRLVQTNLREADTGLDPERLIRQLEELSANALLFGMGGIVAHYPTTVEFHYPSRTLPKDRDTFGDVLRLARAKNIRVIGRFDLSKAQKPVYDAHPEWFFQRSNGEPVIYNGLYSTCINAGYYRSHALKILAEALDRYELDGLFFNMFGNPATDYSGAPTGNCHCADCRKRYGKPIPPRTDAAYATFLNQSREEVAASIGELIHRKRPNAAFLTYIQNHVDGIMSESNTAVDRSLPMWPYSASDNVNRARTSEPGKMAFNLCIGFVDIPYRLVTVAPAEIQQRMYQNMAHGAGPAFVALGTLDQEDRSGLLAAKKVFEFHKKHSSLYIHQQNAARVLLLGARGPAYQGLFRILTEQHIPFTISDNWRWLSGPSDRYDLVISANGLPAELEAWIRNGGKVLATGAIEPGFPIGRVVKRWPSTRSAYFRVHRKFPSLANTNLVFLDGPLLEFEPQPDSALTLITPAMYGPPEKVSEDARETRIPGVIQLELGKGRLAFLPWDVGGLYNRHGSPGHSGLVTGLIDALAVPRQLKTNAHPLVEITLMRQHSRALIHLVNLTGHFDTAYHASVPMRDIEVEVYGAFKACRAAASGTLLPLRRAGGYTGFSLPHLDAYEAVILE